MMTFFSLAKPNGLVEERDGLQLVSSGLDFSAFNSALLAEPLDTVDSKAFEARVETAARFFRARKERWSFWLCEDMVTPTVLRRVPMILRQYRLRWSSEAPGMTVETLEPPRRTLPAIEVRRVEDVSSRAAFAGITACTFDLPYSICSEIYQSDRSWDGSMQGWVGFVNGQPVATIAATVTPSAVGVYTVGTMPDFRRRGYSERLFREVVGELRKQTGITRVILQATPLGYPLYHKMGFRKATQFSIFLSEH